MEFLGKHRLVAHPDHGPRSRLAVEVEVGLSRGSHLSLIYAVEPAGALRLPDHASERTDRLWKRTCFEMFVKPATGPGYREFNFAPMFAWNVYSFSSWRRGMDAFDVDEPPHLVDCRLDDRRPLFPERYELDVLLGGDLMPGGGDRLSLTAILEETDGTRSYWALAHPPGDPNFHHPDCFRLRLPPAA